MRGARSDRQAWIDLDLVHRELGSVSPFAVDAAVAFAALGGWLGHRRRPAVGHGVMLGARRALTASLAGFIFT